MLGNIFYLLMFDKSGIIEYFITILLAQMHILWLSFRLQCWKCCTVSFTASEGVPLTLSVLICMAHLHQSLLVTVILMQIIQIHTISRSREVSIRHGFFLSVTGTKIPLSGHLLSTLFYHHQ